MPSAAWNWTLDGATDLLRRRDRFRVECEFESDDCHEAELCCCNFGTPPLTVLMYTRRLLQLVFANLVPRLCILV